MKIKVLTLSMAFMVNATAALACTSPAGTEGEVIYNSTEKTLQYCDGTTWHDLKATKIGQLDESLFSKFMAWVEEKVSA